ncbi:MAG TPA: DUF424 family protein [Candidatus Woesearchaeota archaeon]|nr:DUF424 family protein [Candidatus Woesearchaeota archaeon]
MKFWVKIQEIRQDVRNEHIVAVCDHDLLGKTVENTKISESFYKGELMEKDKMVTELKKATIGNIFGNNAVDAAIEAGITAEQNVRKFDGIKHAQIFIFG